MNKGIYRLVWNRRLGAPQVVSEAAKPSACGEACHREPAPRPGP